jgi:hypothetical protein
MAAARPVFGTKPWKSSRATRSSAHLTNDTGRGPRSFHFNKKIFCLRVLVELTHQLRRYKLVKTGTIKANLPKHVRRIASPTDFYYAVATAEMLIVDG